MGWSYEAYGSRFATKKEFLLAEFPAGTKFLASSWSGSACAMVVVPPMNANGDTPAPYVSVSLLGGSAATGFGVKHMDESCGPNEVGFSKKFLAAVEKHVPLPEYGYAAEWREGVRKACGRRLLG